MRKKLLLTLLSLMLLVLIPMTGCGGGAGGSNETDEIKATVDGFMGCLQEGDLEGMKAYTDPELFEADGTLADLTQLESLDDQFSSSLGMDADDLSDSTKAKLEEFVGTLLSGLVKSYEIGEITEADGKASVNLTTTFGFNPDKIDEIDVNDEIEEMATKYVEEHMDELMDVYNEGGQDAIIAKVLDDLIADILDKYSEEITNTGETTEQTVMTLEKKDGKWLVTGDEAKEN